MSKEVSKSWFCVFNNPANHGYEGIPEEVVRRVIDEWCEDDPCRSCAVAYCVSAEGLPHLHCVFESTKAMRFSQIKKAFPSMNIVPTKGNKEQAEDYINKRGKWEEKGETILYSETRGVIVGAQGSRNDLKAIEDLLTQGLTPGEIMALSLSYRKYEKIIRSAYYAKRNSETPFMLERNVILHVGEPGSGKSYTAKELIDLHGEENVYFLTDCDIGGFDNYNGEPILFIDEFRGQFKFHVLLNSVLSTYKAQVHSRYSNIYALWTEVHITTVLPPEMLYNNMVTENRNFDSFEQLKRRIDFIVYHWRDENGNYNKFIMPMSEYKDYETLEALALNSVRTDGKVYPFDD